jgi:uncharacterized membrane protein
MEAKAKVLGHAVHQTLIPYPLALLTTAIIFDVVHLFTGNPLWSVIAFWMIALVGGGLILLTSWLGGELVDRLGVGVDDGANLDAPSSLSGRPAGDTTPRATR